MTYRLSLSAEAEKILDRMDRALERRCRLRLLELAHDPFDPRLSAPLKQRAAVRKCRVGTKGRFNPGLLGLTALVVVLASLRIRRMEINYGAE